MAWPSEQKKNYNTFKPAKAELFKWWRWYFARRTAWIETKMSPIASALVKMMAYLITLPTTILKSKFAPKAYQTLITKNSNSI
jgi:hypothetical protein